LSCFFKLAQATAQDKDLRGHQRQCRAHPDFGQHCIASARDTLLTVPVTLPLGRLQSGGSAALEFVYFTENLWEWLDRPFDTPPLAPDQLELKLDSIRTADDQPVLENEKCNLNSPTKLWLPPSKKHYLDSSGIGQEIFPNHAGCNTATGRAVTAGSRICPLRGLVRKRENKKLPSAPPKPPKRNKRLMARPPSSPACPEKSPTTAPSGRVRMKCRPKQQGLRCFCEIYRMRQ